MNEKKPKRYYRLRWRFDFAAKPSKFGTWDLVGAKTYGAWSIPKEGLVRAVIEGEEIPTAEHPSQNIVQLLEVFGDEYVSCQGEVVSKIPAGGFIDGTVRPQAQVYGISLLTGTEKISVFRDGSNVRRPLTEDEKRFKIYEHMAGA